MSTDERDRLIIMYRRRGLTYKKIARAVGCTESVVAKAVTKARRPAPRQPGDVDNIGTAPEAW